MTREALRAMVEEASDFPMLPPNATQIARLTTDLSAPVKEIASKIESDELLLDRMFAIVNAPFYSVSGDITRITDAISLLGYKKVCNLAVGISALGIFPIKKEQGFDYGSFWKQSVIAGVSAGLIASRIPGDNPADVFSAAMLQNIGVLFLVREHPVEYGTALGISRGQHVPFVVAERESWGGDHAQLGAQICLNWQMPQLLAEVIRHHNFVELRESIPDGTKVLVQIVHLSGLMAEVLEDLEDESARERLDDLSREFFGFGPKTIDRLLLKVPDLAQSIGSSFGLDMGGTVSRGTGPGEPKYHVICPACHVEDQQGKFCGECGQALLIITTPRVKKNGAQEKYWSQKTPLPVGARFVLSSRSWAVFQLKRAMVSKPWNWREETHRGCF